MEMELMFIESRSKYNFEGTIEKLSEIIVEGGWKVIQILDLQEIMRKNGKEILPVRVIELCKPDYAFRLLSEDAFRLYSSMLPCRISVYEKSDGNTLVSRINAAMLASQLGGTAQEVMTGAFNDAEMFIKKVSED